LLLLEKTVCLLHEAPLSCEIATKDVSPAAIRIDSETCSTQYKASPLVVTCVSVHVVPLSDEYSTLPPTVAATTLLIPPLA
jgi:hypothetical protein